MTYQAALDIIMKNGAVSELDADRIFQSYRALKVLKYNAHDGYQITHGGFFDHEVILRALEQAQRTNA